MSRDHQRRASVRRQCSGKTRYRDNAEAVRSRQIRERESGLTLRIYECGICQGLHLTKTESVVRSALTICEPVQRPPRLRRKFDWSIFDKRIPT